MDCLKGTNASDPTTALQPYHDDEIETGEAKKNSSTNNSHHPPSHVRQASFLGRILRKGTSKRDIGIEENPKEEIFLRILADSILFIKANGLLTVGIFRIPGDVANVKLLEEAYDRGEENVLEKMPCSVHDVATLLKQSIRNLPEPLVPFSVYKRFLRAARKHEDLMMGQSHPPPGHRRAHSTGGTVDTTSSPGSKRMSRQINGICSVALTLPTQNCRCLSMVLNLLYIISQVEENKMTTQALAVIFAPTLMKTPPEVPSQVVLRDMPVAIAATKTLIENAVEILPHPDPTYVQNIASGTCIA